MTKKLKQLAPQKRSYIEDEGKILRVSHSLPFKKSVVWAALLDGESWTKWLDLTKVTWTSPQPFCEGTTRTVEGHSTMEEEFFIWDEGERMAFYVTASDLPLVKAFAEDYKLVETPTGCDIHWAFRCDANFIVKFMINRAIKAAFTKGFKDLELYLGQNLEKFETAQTATS